MAEQMIDYYHLDPEPLAFSALPRLWHHSGGGPR